MLEQSPDQSTRRPTRWPSSVPEPAEGCPPARFDRGDGGTRVNVFFTAKGEAKSAATVQHERLADAAEAERMKAFWRDRVAALSEALERPGASAPRG